MQVLHCISSKITLWANPPFDMVGDIRRIQYVAAL